MIWLTPFDAKTLQPTAPSVPSGFDTLEQTVVAMGKPRSRRGPYVIYDADEQGESRLIFSRLQWA